MSGIPELAWVAEWGPWVLAALFGASALEYLFPPFPGDTVTLAGAFLAAHGTLPWPGVFAAVTLGSLVGAAGDYALGRAIAARLSREGPRSERAARWRARMARVEAAYRRHGDAYILVNRFLPGVRAFFFVAAGLSGMRFGRVMAFGALSALIWNGLVLLAGAGLAHSWEELRALFSRYTAAASIAVGAFVAILAARALVGRLRRATSRRNGGSGG